MPSPALIATQLTDHSARANTLTVAGLEVLGLAGTTYSVPIQSIRINEDGPGGVSSMSFDIWDPSAQVTILEGDTVEQWDVADAFCRFGGFVESAEARPAFGSGRIISVQCVGFESIIDWAIITADVTIASGTDIADAVERLIGLAEGRIGLYAQALPLGSSTSAAITITAGTSLRGALTQLGTVFSTAGFPLFNPTPSGLVATVSQTRGLWVIADDGQMSNWGYPDLTITDTTPPSTEAASNLRHTRDGGAVVRGVYVQGSSGANSGLATDGTGKPGRIAFIDDPTIDSVTKLQLAQSAYLSQYVVATRGSFDKQWTPSTNARAGSRVTITDAPSGATGTHRIYSITKTFDTGGVESWAISYGTLKPSAMRLVRRLTRSTRS